jgi:site-specific recombinase XerD
MEMNTLISYNSGVEKYLAYCVWRGTRHFTLPSTEADLEDFVMWAGRNTYTSNDGKISANSIKKYLIALKP